MRVLLVQPLAGLVDPGSWVRNCFMEPLGLEYVAASAAAAGHDVRCVHPVADEVEFEGLLRRECPDVVGYSVYSYAFGQATRWARLARALSPGVINVFGGYHPSGALVTVANAPCVDYVVAGEGERAFVELLACLERGGRKPRIAGVAYHGISNEAHFFRAKRCTTPDGLPGPFRDPALLAHTVSRQIMYPPPSGQKSVAQVVYGRGCNHACAFCASETIWGRRTIWRSAAAVADEIEALTRDYGTNLIFFSDVSMASDAGRLRDLCEELIARDLPVYWWCMCRIDELDSELMLLMRRAKAVKLTVGIESAVEAVFRSIKGTALAWDTTCDRLAAAAQCGLIVRATLMVDHPGATKDYYSVLARSMEHLPAHEIRVSFCTPFPGTPLHGQHLSESCVDTAQLDDFTTEMPIFCAGGLTKEDLLCMRRDLVCRFYGSAAYESRLRNTTARFPHLRESFDEFLVFADSQGLLPAAMASRLRRAIAGWEMAAAGGGTDVRGTVIACSDGLAVSKS